MDLSPDFLDSLRHRGDPIADDVMLALDDKEEKRASTLFRAIVETDDPVPKGLPEPARLYFEETAALPPWADPKLILAGERVFEQYGAELILGLFCSALPQCYANYRGVGVLTLTGRMQGRAVEARVMETAQFLCDIVGEGGLGPEGRGIRSAQKVRLMHAGVRELISGLPPGRYDPANGTPICQEDLAFTLMTFSVVLLDALASLGVKVPSEDREAWVHLWRVAGHFIGVADDANPRNYKEAQAFAAAYRRRNFGPGEDGRELTASLIRFLQSFAGKMLHTKVFKPFPAAFIRRMNGPELAKMLGVKPEPTAEKLIDLEVKMVKLLDEFLPDRIGIPSLFGRWLDELVRGFAVLNRGGKAAPFRIPQHVKGTRRVARRKTKR